MKRNIQILSKRLCRQQPLYSLARRASSSALMIKRVNLSPNNYQINGQLNSSINQDYKLNGKLDKSLQNDINFNHSNNTLFTSIFNPLKRIDITAYCGYVDKHGIAGFIETDNIPYFNVSMNKLRQVDRTLKLYNKEQNELLSVFLLLKLYANKFTDKRVEIYCDNVCVINMLNDYKSKKSVNVRSQLLINKIRNICITYKINAHWSRILGIPEITIDRLARSTTNPFQYLKYKAQSKPNAMAFQYLNEAK